MDINKLLKRKAHAYSAVFSTHDGKTVLMDLIKMGHILSSTMGKDRDETIFKEGERNMVLRILSNINMTPEKVEELIRRQGELT